MSYSRFIEADVYVFMHVSGYLQCCGCWISDLNPVDPDYHNSFNAHSTQEMVDHIVKHKRRGHRVPADLIENLWQDDEENFPKTEDNYEPEETW